MHAHAHAHVEEIETMAKIKAWASVVRFVIMATILYFFVVGIFRTTVAGTAELCLKDRAACENIVKKWG